MRRKDIQVVKCGADQYRRESGQQSHTSIDLRSRLQLNAPPSRIRQPPNHLVLHQAGGKLEFSYFPNRGLISLVVVMKDGKTGWKLAIVGNEGFTGTLAAVGLTRSPLHTVVQITGDGFRVEVGALQNTLESAPHLRLMLSRYAAIRSMQVAQTAACNRLHDIGQRLARWLADDPGSSGFWIAAHHS